MAEIIKALFDGLLDSRMLLLLAAVFGYLLKRDLKETKEVVQEVKHLNTAQDGKLDNITLLVDGRYGEVLKELSDMKDLFATETGRHADRRAADLAKEKYNEQKMRVDVAQEIARTNADTAAVVADTEAAKEEQ